MQAHYIEPIKQHPSFIKLQRERKRLAYLLTVSMLTVYFAFVLTIAFVPEFLAKPIYKGSVITIGLPIGICVILFAIAVTGIYVYKANRQFDHYCHDIHKDIVEL